MKCVTLPICSFLIAAGLVAQQLPPLRPPAIPLIVHDPYFSVWSMSDQITETQTRHWTGTDQPLAGYLRIDGSPYRFIGTGARGSAAMTQSGREVTPTRTIYTFEAAGIELTLTFLTPALPTDLDVLSRPVTYVNFSARATDGRSHKVELYFDVSSVLAVNTPEQRMTFSRMLMPGWMSCARGQRSNQYSRSPGTICGSIGVTSIWRSIKLSRRPRLS